MLGTLGTQGDGGTVAYEKAPQNFYKGDGDGYSLCKSDCFPIWFRPVHEKIVRERLDGAIRLLRGASAGSSLGETGERSLLEKLRKTFMRGWIWI